MRVNQYLEMSTLEPEANILISDVRTYINTNSWNKVSLNWASRKHSPSMVRYWASKSITMIGRRGSLMCNSIPRRAPSNASKTNPTINSRSPSTPFSMIRFSPQKTKLNQRTTLYIRDIHYPNSLDDLKRDLKIHLLTFGEIESLQVTHDSK